MHSDLQDFVLKMLKLNNLISLCLPLPSEPDLNFVTVWIASKTFLWWILIMSLTYIILYTHLAISRIAGSLFSLQILFCVLHAAMNLENHDMEGAHRSRKLWASLMRGQPNPVSSADNCWEKKLRPRLWYGSGNPRLEFTYSLYLPSSLDHIVSAL